MGHASILKPNAEGRETVFIVQTGTASVAKRASWLVGVAVLGFVLDEVTKGVSAGGVGANLCAAFTLHVYRKPPRPSSTACAFSGYNLPVRHDPDEGIDG
jgi:hypothetical protein